MVPIALYCKSYRTDLKRVIRLAASIKKWNIDQLPFFISIPQQDELLFHQHLSDFDVQIIADESIISSNPRHDILHICKLPGHISQQIVKSEFWRLGFSQSYVCLDSDALFIRGFRASDFLQDEKTPYTVMDEGHEFLDSALSAGKRHLIESFLSDAGRVQSQFERTGRTYSFGPFPVIWHKDVWKCLDQEFLQPKKMTLMDAIVQIPVESHWYGESLLKYRAIPLMPCQPLFKVYHYAWQLDADRRRGLNEIQLASLYTGIIYQSAWERELDWPREGGSLASHIARRLKRKLGRI